MHKYHLVNLMCTYTVLLRHIWQTLSTWITHGKNAPTKFDVSNYLGQRTCGSHWSCFEGSHLSSQSRFLSMTYSGKWLTLPAEEHHKRHHRWHWGQRRPHGHLRGCAHWTSLNLLLYEMMCEVGVHSHLQIRQQSVFAPSLHISRKVCD